MKKDIEKMRDVAKDIITSEIITKEEINTFIDRFYSIMRKHGICQGEKGPNYIQTDNFEWTMCKELFISRIADTIQLELVFNKVPDDLEHY